MNIGSPISPLGVGRLVGDLVMTQDRCIGSLVEKLPPLHVLPSGENNYLMFFHAQQLKKIKNISPTAPPTVACRFGNGGVNRVVLAVCSFMLFCGNWKGSCRLLLVFLVWIHCSELLLGEYCILFGLFLSNQSIAFPPSTIVDRPFSSISSLILIDSGSIRITGIRARHQLLIMPPKDLVDDVEALKASQETMAKTQEGMVQSIQALTEQIRLFCETAPLGRPGGGDSPGSAANYPATAPQQQGHISTRFSRLDFPKFTGEAVMEWIYRCEQFFDIDATPEDQKVKVASAHIEGKALYWHQAYMKARITRQWPQWEEYGKAIAGRFGSLLFDDPMSDLKNLRQKGSVQTYVDEFDTLLHRVDISEEYAISFFLAGLRDEIEFAVRMFQPKTLRDVCSLARLQEHQITATQRKGGGGLVMAGPGKERQPPPIKWQSNNFGHGNTSASVPGRRSHPRLTPKEMDEKRSKGLCFWCDSKFTPGHRCMDKQQSYTLELVPEEEDGEAGEEGEVEGDPEYGEELIMVEEGSSEGAVPQVSFHALTGLTHFHTMRVIASYQGKPISILIDSGSTHNFIDVNAASRLQCKLTPIPMFNVAIANGRTIASAHKVEEFQWRMQGVCFASEMLVLPLGGCEVVLGVQWLITLGVVHWDFKNLQMEFISQGRKISLRGSQSTTGTWTKQQRMQKLITKGGGQCSMMAVCSIEEQPTEGEKGHGPGKKPAWLEPQLGKTREKQLATVLHTFQDVFGEPRELPPRRGHEHHIHLKDEKAEINLRPYRYSPLQKTEIEGLVKEMLEVGTIRPSGSPFASPVVLVKKTDGSWRLCVDYRKLNQNTIKDNFPIPLIEELIDELHGATFFSKLDLRAGYHQVRMAEGDVYKTAFRTHHGHFEFLVMPFGLTNAPSTFQSLMNKLFQPQLRKSILVFFDDILVFSSSWEAHLAHLEATLGVLRAHRLFLKRSKCGFGLREVHYLGHVISDKGVATDPTKIRAMLEWPIPNSLKKLRGFLGLTGYYRRFIKEYGTIAKPLTKLLKEAHFSWDVEAARAFENLKKAVSEPPVLALPNFAKPFTVETDASDSGVGAVLTQENRPMAYFSKALGTKNKLLPAYEKEMLAIVLAVQHWRHYLVGGKFIIKTDHQSLRFLTDQKLVTPAQQKYLYKLMGYDYVIHYRQGKENVCADALSRQYEGVAKGTEERAAELCGLSIVSSDLIQRVKLSWQGDARVQKIIEQKERDESAKPDYTWQHGLLKRKGKLLIGDDAALKQQLLHIYHDGAVGGHSGVTATYHRLKKMFYWKRMKPDVHTYIQHCTVCQKCKSDNQRPAGLLQPLPIPERIWQDISLDFIDGLPKSKGKSTIFVVVDRLSKNAHFMAMSHPYTAEGVAQVFMDAVFRLHGLPASIVSDRGAVFVSTFWQELFKTLKVQLKLSSAYHPQTDGQTEVVNRCIEGYLRCMCFERPRGWAEGLPLAEWWYNTTFHSAIRMTPYEVVYGQEPVLHIPYLEGATRVGEVDRSLAARERVIGILKHNLAQAQNRMKVLADKQRRERHLEVGTWAYVRLQPYRQTSLRSHGAQKLAQKYFGPFRVAEKIGTVAYKLQLPEDAKIHPTFHISQLKEHKGAPPLTTVALPETVNEEGNLLVEPMAVLARRIIPKNGRVATQLLIHWTNSSRDDATWEDLEVLRNRFPNFVP
ncbi:hypothetical protein KSP39_PZI021790 [Platanthera zijinensis]|uniref:Reverse transcriptase n=1 Tax=Platanthera zijinensis TaxID=2320716 RepID=A0AAP0AXL9_9ASPA